MDGVVLEMLNEIPCRVCLKTWMALWMWNRVWCSGGQINDCCKIRQFFWPLSQWIKHCGWARAKEGWHHSTLSELGPPLRLWLFRCRRSKTWRVFSCLGSHESVAELGHYCSLYHHVLFTNWWKVSALLWNTSFQDMTVLICHVAPPQVVKCQCLKFWRIMWL